MYYLSEMFLGYITTNKLFDLIDLHKRSILRDFAVRINNFNLYYMNMYLIYKMYYNTCIF